MDYQAARCCQGEYWVWERACCVTHRDTHYGECDYGFILKDIISIEAPKYGDVLFLRAWTPEERQHRIERRQKVR
jgi:hypothetical protein